MKLMCSLAMAIVTTPLPGAELPPIRHAFTVIAHRGNHSRAHENTLTALQHTVDAGIDYAEIDVRRTADSRYVLLHDSRVDRMTDGHGAVSALTLAQIKALHVQDPQRPQIAPDRVPTLNEALELAKGRLNLYIDFKDGDRPAVARIIREAKVMGHILIYDRAKHADEWRRCLPEAPLILSPPDETKTVKELADFVQQTQAEVVDGDWTLYSSEMVRAAQAVGAQVWPDVDVERGPALEECFRKVVMLGLRGVQTDCPEELVAWLKQRGLR